MRRAKTFNHDYRWRPNPNFKHIPDDLYWYIWNLYSKADGYVKICSGANRRGRLYPVNTLLDREKLSAILCSHRFKNSSNLYMSIGTYRDNRYARETNLLSVCAVTVDLDFNDGTKGMSALPEEDFKAILNHVYEMCRSDRHSTHDPIPLPTYIEYGYNIRLIYLIDTFGIPKGGKQHKSCVNLLKRLFFVLCEKVRTYTAFDFNPDPKPRLTSFVRIPYSYNKKDFGHVEYNASHEPKWIPYVRHYPIRIIMPGDRYRIQDLIDAVLPKEMPDWYENWKIKSKKVSAAGIRKKYYSLKELGQKRMQDLSTLQARGWDCGYRTIMCHLYFQSAQLAGYSKEEAAQLTRTFNSLFKYPLPVRELSVNCCKTSKRYRYKDQTIRQLLECEDQKDLFRGTGLTSADSSRNYRSRKRAAAYAAGETKAQKMAEETSCILKLRKSGMTISAIAAQLAISTSTVKRRLKSESLQVPVPSKTGFPDFAPDYFSLKTECGQKGTLSSPEKTGAHKTPDNA